MSPIDKSLKEENERVTSPRSDPGRKNGSAANVHGPGQEQPVPPRRPFSGYTYYPYPPDALSPKEKLPKEGEKSTAGQFPPLPPWQHPAGYFPPAYYPPPPPDNLSPSFQSPEDGVKEVRSPILAPAEQQPMSPKDKPSTEETEKNAFGTPESSYRDRMSAAAPHQWKYPPGFYHPYPPYQYPYYHGYPPYPSPVQYNSPPFGSPQYMYPEPPPSYRERLDAPMDAAPQDPNFAPPLLPPDVAEGLEDASSAARPRIYVKSKIPTPRKILDMRSKKNARSRDRAERHRQRFEAIANKPEWERTEEDKEALSKFNDRRGHKNNRSRERSVERTQEVNRILAIPERKRSQVERQFLETVMAAKARKNLGDRLRRQRTKEQKMQYQFQGQHYPPGAPPPPDVPPNAVSLQFSTDPHPRLAAVGEQVAASIEEKSSIPEDDMEHSNPNGDEHMKVEEV